MTRSARSTHRSISRLASRLRASTSSVSRLDAFNKLLDLQANLKSIRHRYALGRHGGQRHGHDRCQVAVSSHQQSEAASNMAASVEQMTVSINHVANRSQEANRLSSVSGQLAEQGEAIIGQTTDDINDLDDGR